MRLKESRVYTQTNAKARRETAGKKGGSWFLMGRWEEKGAGEPVITYAIEVHGVYKESLN